MSRSQMASERRALLDEGARERLGDEDFGVDRRTLQIVDVFDGKRPCGDDEREVVGGRLVLGQQRLSPVMRQTAHDSDVLPQDLPRRLVLELLDEVAAGD